jgi:hypothetical protein
MTDALSPTLVKGRTLPHGQARVENRPEHPAIRFASQSRTSLRRSSVIFSGPRVSAWYGRVDDDDGKVQQWKHVKRIRQSLLVNHGAAWVGGRLTLGVGLRALGGSGRGFIDRPTRRHCAPTLFTSLSFARQAGGDVAERSCQPTASQTMAAAERHVLTWCTKGRATIAASAFLVRQGAP